MELLRQLLELQHERGYLDDALLHEVAQREDVPLFRLEELVSYYPHFRRTPPPRRTVQVCRDVVCAMADCAKSRARLEERLAGRDDVEVQEVSCLGRCDAAPALAVQEVPLTPTSLVDLDCVMECIDAPAPPVFQTLGDGPRRFQCDPYKDPAFHFRVIRALGASKSRDPSHYLDSLKRSVLRGMGGAGFPTGRKWEMVIAESPTSRKSGRAPTWHSTTA